MFAAVSNKIAFLSTLTAAVALVSVGCTQPQNTAQNTAQRKYYHDRSVGIGSNIPHSYTDSASANASSQSNLSDTNQQEFQQMQRTAGNQLGGAPTGGGR